MKTPLALAALLLAGNDFDRARADFKKAVETLNAPAAKDAAERLARADNRKAVDALLEGYADCARQIKFLWDDKVRAILEFQAAEKYDKALDQKGQAIEAKIMRLEALKRSVLPALAGVRTEESVKELLAELRAARGDWTRRAGIAEALAQVPSLEVPAALVEALRKDPEPQVRIAAMDALRALKPSHPDLVPAAVAQLSADAWQARSAAVALLRALGSREAIDPLIEALGRNDGRLRHEINEALVGLTGVNKHGDPATWKWWWNENKEKVRAGGFKPKPGEAAGKGQENGTTFYGIPVHSRHVVFILDRSGSMAAPSEWDFPPDVATGPAPGLDVKKQGDRKIDVARWQLKRALAMLPDGTEFNVIFYNHQWTVFADGMARLSPATRRQVFEFIDGLEPAGRTNIYDPLEKGLSFASVAGKADKIPALRGRTITSADRSEKSTADTVFLLTDGLPNSGQVPAPDDIVLKVRELNKTRRVKIHTIGVFSPRDAEGESGGRFLKQLAEESGGTYTTAPKKK